MIFQKKTRKGLFKYPTTMNQAEIEYLEEKTHLGLIRTPDNKSEHAIQDTIQKARASYLYLIYGLQGLKWFPPSDWGAYNQDCAYSFEV